MTVWELVSRKTIVSQLGCWLWTGSTNGKGYARIHFGGKLIYVHREMKKAAGHTLNGGMVLDHLCRNPSCVNPGHLEEVSCQENIHRGKQGQQTHCLRGHKYDEKNTAYHNPLKKNGRRYCRACKNEKRRLAPCK